MILVDSSYLIFIHKLCILTSCKIAYFCSTEEESSGETEKQEDLLLSFCLCSSLEGEGLKSKVGHVELIVQTSLSLNYLL